MIWEFNREEGFWSSFSYKRNNGTAFQWVISVTEAGKFDLKESDTELCSGVAPFDTLAAAKAFCDAFESAFRDLEDTPEAMTHDNIESIQNDIKCVMGYADVGIVQRLRDYDNFNDNDADDAADMLEFFFGQMQMHSPKMNGQHSYRFRSSGWPMSHCVGPDVEAAVRAAMAEIKRSRIEESSKSKRNNVGEGSANEWYRYDESETYVRKQTEKAPMSENIDYSVLVTAPELLDPTPKKLVATWECVVTETDGDIVYCDAHSLDGTGNRELWEAEVSGNKWDEGDAFYVVRTVE